jgi:photosystem II stability/assembly factor-like uncharacterized protein
MVRLLILFVFSLSFFTGESQEIISIHSGGSASLRGLCSVTDKVIWVSGSSGTVGLSIDGGNNWKWMHVPYSEKSDFRDIEAFNEKEAIILGITEPAVILRTMDGGDSWTTQYEDSSKSAFLDAMDFRNGQAIAVGDPVGTKQYLIESNDRGITWKRVNLPDSDSTHPGEAYFAASGSNIKWFGKDAWALVSGGKQSCLYVISRRFPLLLNQGAETTGANSIAINPSDSTQAFIVGGDFSNDTTRHGNSLRIQFNPFSQLSPISPPHGYRSCVEYLNNKQLICCGTSGVDFSDDGGLRWKLISHNSFHVCRRSKTGGKIFLAGAHGAIAVLELPKE